MVMNVQISLEGGRKVTLEPFSGGLFAVYAKDAELDLGGAEPAYVPGFCHGGRVYCFHSTGSGRNGRIIYQDVTQD